MPTPTEHFPLPLDLLIGRLEAAGFRVDTSRRLRVLRVFDDLGNPFVGGHFEELKYLLSPLVSRSPQEQERFYEVFDAFWRECEAEAQQVEAAGDFAKSEKVAEGVRVLAKPKRRWWWWWVGAGLMVLVGAVLPFVGTEGYFQKSLPRPIMEGDTLRHKGVIVTTTHSILDIQLPAIRTTSFYWEIRDSAMRVTLHRDTGDLVWPVSEKQGSYISVFQKTTVSAWFWEVVRHDTFRVKILCSNPPEVSEIIPSAKPPYLFNTKYKFSIQTEPGCRVVWNFGGLESRNTADATGRSFIQTEIEPSGAGSTLFILNATVHRPENIGYCYTSKTLNIEIGNDKPILPLTPFQRDDSFSVFIISRLGWLLIALPLLLAGWFFYRWRKKRNTPAPQKTPEELAEQYPITDAGPYFIPYRSQEHSITVPREFFRIAELLRRREEGQRRYFDGPATVRATVESGGFPAWRERAVTRPAEYLFLVERPDERDQQGKLFARLCDFLKRRDVPLVTFFHDGSFQHFWNAEYADGLPPLELRRRYPHHRLVLLGAAHGLVNPYATRQPELLRGPLDWLTHWPRRLLLTPEPVAAWSFQEALLHRHFLVFPADTEGILSGIDLLDRTEEYHAGRFERWQEGRAPRHSPETHRYRTWKTAAEHADYLRHDPDCFRWLCALAVCAQPDWSLTLAIGRAIGAEVTHDRLLLLTRIPWLSQNQPNDGLRLELLRQLSPADEQAARAAVAHELEAVRSVTANSFAETERTANAAVQNFALDPRDEAHKQAIRELRTLGLLSGSQEAELDFIVQEKADKSGLPNSAGAGIASWLEAPAPKRFWTKDMDKGLLSVLLSAIFAIALLLVSSKQEKPLPKPFEWLTEDVAQSADVLQRNERAIAIAERALAVEDYQQWLGLQDSVRVADSLFQEVARDRMISLSRGQYDHVLGINLPIFRYNLAAKDFNFYQTEGLPADALRKPLRGFGSAQTNWGGREDFTKRFRLDLDAQHGQGLCYYYLSNSVKKVADTFAQHSSLLDSAKFMLERIHAQESVGYYYFDSIQTTIPVNLQTLLEAEKAKDKGDAPADTDEAMQQKIVGYWVGAVGSWKALTVFGKDGTATMQTYNSANKLMQTASGRWSVENKTLLLEQSDVTKSRITHLDNNRLTLDDGTTKPPTFRRIQPTDRDRDGVLDVVDNCPDEKGGAENAGCPEGGLNAARLSHTFAHKGDIWSVTFSPNGKRLATGSTDKTAKIWDIENGKALVSLSNQSVYYAIDFSPDGKKLVTGSNVATIWDLGSGKEIKTLARGYGAITSVDFSPDARYLSIGTIANSAVLWNLDLDKEITFYYPSIVSSVTFSPNGRQLAFGCRDKTVKIQDLESNKENTLAGHTADVSSVAFSPDGRLLATGSEDNTAKIWDLESGKVLTTLEGHSSSVWSVAFSPDGKTLATGSEDNTAIIWDLESGKVLITLEGHSNSVRSVAFSPDGKRLATGSFDNTAKIWELLTKREVSKASKQ